jgi:hypothetical protein
MQPATPASYPVTPGHGHREGDRCGGTPAGTFLPSRVFLKGVPQADTNGFVTALAVRSARLQGLPVPASWLDGLQACRSTQGGFRFWPAALHPRWAPVLPDDCDDTAVMTLELCLAGRLPVADARRIACLNLAQHRVRSLPAQGPPWLRLGVFKTWARDDSETDLVDCTAQTNALALLALLGLWHVPGVAQACEMLIAALSHAGASESRAASLSPFYPDPSEWVLALEHAVASGARALEPLLAQVRQQPWAVAAWERVRRPEHEVCSSPYGSARWVSPDLAAVRRGVGPSLTVSQTQPLVGAQTARTSGLGRIRQRHHL